MRGVLIEMGGARHTPQTPQICVPIELALDRLLGQPLETRLAAPASAAAAGAGSATAAAVAATAGPALGLGTCLVDDEVAIAEQAAVQHLDGLGRFLLRRHLDEPEAARSTRELVRDDADRLDSAGLLEQLAQIFFRGLKRKSTDRGFVGRRPTPPAVRRSAS